MLAKLPIAARLVARFIVELVRANFAVAKVVLSPTMSIHPGIFAFHTRLTTPLGVTSLANLITLTPGTLTVDVSSDMKILYIHALDAEEPQEVMLEIRRSFEDKLLELER